MDRTATVLLCIAILAVVLLTACGGGTAYDDSDRPDGCTSPAAQYQVNPPIRDCVPATPTPR